jgi:RNA polymerase sigma-70 factor (ECF subfamily)
VPHSPRHLANHANRNGPSGYLVGVAQKPELQPRSAGPSDAALVVAARAGEAWAREALFRRYIRMVFGLVYRLVGRDDETEDLVQECFAQALAHLGGLSEPQAFGGWLTSVVVRTVHKTLRRRVIANRLGLRRQREPLDVESLVSRSAPADAVAELRAVYRILEGLSPRVRVALVLRRVEGMSQDEVASAMGVSVSTAKRLIVEAELALDGAFDSRKSRKQA